MTEKTVHPRSVLRRTMLAGTAGVIGGLLAAIFGLIDWIPVPAGTRAKRLGLWHGGGNVIVVLLFIWGWWMRSQAVGYVPANAAITISCFAIALALLTGWLGGELVYRLNIGVDEGAHPDAPNSLSARPANNNARSARSV